MERYPINLQVFSDFLGDQAQTIDHHRLKMALETAIAACVEYTGYPLTNQCDHRTRQGVLFMASALLVMPEIHHVAMLDIPLMVKGFWLDHGNLYGQTGASGSAGASTEAIFSASLSSTPAKKARKNAAKTH